MIPDREPLRFRELTAPGAGAIRVLELAGPGALDTLRSLSGREAWECGALRLALLRAPDAQSPEGQVPEAREVLDEALCHVVDEQRVELHVHGSEPLVREIRELCQNQFGAIVAEREDPGLSLEERALALVPRAPCEPGARLLLDQASGVLRREIERLLVAEGAELRSGLGALEEAGRIAGYALRKTPVVIAGPVNAGKSTLFNLLVRRADRALMSPVPGTTRDAVAEPALFGPWPVQLYDTAGTRDLDGESEDGDDRVERAGQELAQRLCERAELVLWLQPAASDPSPSPRPEPLAHPDRKVHLLRSMSDRAGPGRALADPALSVHDDPEGAAELCHRVFSEAFTLPKEAWRAGAPAPFDDVTRQAVRRALAEVASEPVSHSKIESAREQLHSLLD